MLAGRLSVLCDWRMDQDLKVFIYQHLSMSLLPHLAIADKHAGLAPKRPRRRRPRAVAPMLSREVSILAVPASSLAVDSALGYQLLGFRILITSLKCRGLRKAKKVTPPKPCFIDCLTDRIPLEAAVCIGQVNVDNDSCLSTPRQLLLNCSAEVGQAFGSAWQADAELPASQAQLLDPRPSLVNQPLGYHPPPDFANANWPRGLAPLLAKEDKPRVKDPSRVLAQLPCKSSFAISTQSLEKLTGASTVANDDHLLKA